MVRDAKHTPGPWHVGPLTIDNTRDALRELLGEAS